MANSRKLFSSYWENTYFSLQKNDGNWRCLELRFAEDNVAAAEPSKPRFRFLASAAAPLDVDATAQVHCVCVFKIYFSDKYVPTKQQFAYKR